MDRSEDKLPAETAVDPIVAEEERLLALVLARIDKGGRKERIAVDDAGAMIELRDALVEAKPEDQASLLEQMHRIEALSKQRGKGDSPPVDRKSPYFGHLRLEESGKRRDVLIGSRSYVEPGGGVQIVDWRNAPVSRLFYRYEEGDDYEEQLGDRMVEGFVLARRTVSIINAVLRRVTCPQGTFSRNTDTSTWRKIDTATARLRVDRDGTATLRPPEDDDYDAEAAGVDGRGGAGDIDRRVPPLPETLRNRGRGFPPRPDAPRAPGRPFSPRPPHQGQRPPPDQGQRPQLHPGQRSQLQQRTARPDAARDADRDHRIPPRPEALSRHARPGARSEGPGATPERSPAPSPGGGRLGVGNDGAPRLDRHLPAIAALIDPRQFELITRPGSGLVVVQGSAGSGKTTIGLHRIAYLAYIEPRRFHADSMMVVVHQRALANYVSRVLPSLDVRGVRVATFAAWAFETRRRAIAGLGQPTTDETPPLVMRAKSHAAILKIVAERQAAMATWCREQLATALAGKPGADEALGAWDASTGPVDGRVTTFARWAKEASLGAATRIALESTGRALRARTRDVISEWASMLTDRAGLADGFARHAPGLFSDGQIDEIHRWCTDRERLRQAGAGHAPRSDHGDGDEEDERFALDEEDDALLLHIHQVQKGRLPAAGSGHLMYEHLMVDEVQDFSPIELAVLIDSTTKKRSITLAGDTAQAIAPEHGFSDWSTLLDALGIPHERVEPLRVSYRSTREIVSCAEHVLGHLAGDVRPVVPRAGAPVEAFPFGSAGEGCEVLGRALKELMRREPTASVALVARHKEQAALYHDALAKAEVPSLRLIQDQDFPFVAGIDVTDVRQTKGLEFDVVILLEAGATSYPETDDARRLLHVAMTRAAHQLWITWTGEPSRLLPPGMG